MRQFTNKVNLKDLNLEELGKWMEEAGQPKYRAKQVWLWLYQKRAASFDEMTDLTKELRAKLTRDAFIPGLEVLEKSVSKDEKTIKFLFALPDKETIETVLMRYEDRLSICLSTQVGCALGCIFCASGVNGVKRDLLTWEIVEQFLEVQRHTQDRIGNVVFMGMGEPLVNYDNTLAAIYFLNRRDTFGIGMRHITVSTSGLADKIRDLADEKLPLHLAVSLHAPNDLLRSKLMPINKRFPIDKLLSACRYYYQINHRRITFEYILIDGVNDSPEAAKDLLHLLSGIYSLINLIPLNLVQEYSYRPSPPHKIREFQNILENGGITVTIRAEKGDELNAACGQLRRHSLKENDNGFQARQLHRRSLISEFKGE